MATFDKFGELPRELRNLIWEFAAHDQPRKIILPLSRFENSILSQEQTEEGAPAILHTSHESREEGLRYYKPHLMFEHYNPFSTKQLTFKHRYIYINVAADFFLHPPSIDVKSGRELFEGWQTFPTTFIVEMNGEEKVSGMAKESMHHVRFDGKVRKFILRAGVGELEILKLIKESGDGDEEKKIFELPQTEGQTGGGDDEGWGAPRLPELSY